MYLWMVIWDCVQFWDTFFSPLEVFRAIQLFCTSTFTHFLPFHLPLEGCHSWDDSPPIWTTSSVGDCAAHTPPVPLKATSRPFGVGTIKDVCLRYERVCERDQVKFLLKVLPENVHHRLLTKNISGSGTGRVAVRCWTLHSSKECVRLCTVLHSSCQENGESYGSEGSEKASNHGLGFQGCH